MAIDDREYIDKLFDKLYKRNNQREDPRVIEKDLEINRKREDLVNYYQILDTLKKTNLFLDEYEDRKKNLNNLGLTALEFAEAEQKLLDEYAVNMDEQLEAKGKLNALALTESGLIKKISTIRSEITNLDKERNSLQEDYNISIERELSLLDRIKNIQEGTNTFINAGKEVVSTLVGSWLEIDKASAIYQRNIGGSAATLSQMRTTTIDIVNNHKLAARIGLTSVELLKMQQQYADAIGRNVSMTSQQLINLGSVGKLVGENNANILNENLDIIGLSSNDANEYVTELFKTSSKNGLAFSKTSSEFINNIKLAQNYTFKDGLNSIRQMALESAKTRLNMQQVASFADKVSTLEGAVTTSANLQMLGGPFAQRFSNPGALLYGALNDPEYLMEQMKSAVASMPSFDSESGRFKYTSFQQQQIRQAAPIMGIDASELLNVGTTVAKQKEIENQIGNTLDNTKIKEYFINASTYDKERKAWGINTPDGNFMTANDLNDNPHIVRELELSREVQAKNSTDILEQNQSREERALNAALQVRDHTANIADKSSKVLDGIGDIITKLSSNNNVLNMIFSVNSANLAVNSARSIGGGVKQLGRGIRGFGAKNKIPIINSVGKNMQFYGKASSIGGAVGALGYLGSDYLAENELLGFSEGNNLHKGTKIGGAVLGGAATGFGIAGPWGAAAGGTLGLLYALHTNSQALDNNTTATKKQMINTVDPSTRLAKGGLLKGNSHANGGIRGTGAFSDIEVEGLEFVVKKEATSKHLNTLTKINNDEFNEEIKPVGITNTTVVNNLNMGSPQNNDSKMSIEPVSINVGGSIKLDNNGRTTSLDRDLLNDPSFIKKLSTLIVKEMNIKENSGYNRSASNQRHY